MEITQIIAGLCIGIGLSAACGFRIFVPMLGACLAHKADLLTFSEGFEWLGGNLALVVFSVATIIEISAYYFPLLDNFLDIIAMPAAIVAGTIMTGAMTSEMTPLLKWSLAFIAGGGAAGTVQAATTVIRGKSTVTTVGLGNPIVSTGELASSASLTAMAVFVPLAAIAILILIISYLAYRLMRKKKR